MGPKSAPVWDWRFSGRYKTLRGHPGCPNFIMVKILFYDIETAGVNAMKADLGFVICFGYKWAHEKNTHCLTIDEQNLHRFDDKKLLKEASKLLNEADVVVTHYGSIFDRRFIQGRLLVNNLPPIAPTKMRDTCMMARSIGNFSSNRLKHLCNILGLGHKKLDNNWPIAWFKVMSGDMRALQGLAKYCKGDVRALEDLYNRIKIFDNNHQRIVEDRTKCRLCGSDVQYRGFSFQINNRYRRFVCKSKSCGKWDRETTAVK